MILGPAEYALVGLFPVQLRRLHAPYRLHRQRELSFPVRDDFLQGGFVFRQNFPVRRGQGNGSAGPYLAQTDEPVPQGARHR